MHDSAKKLFKLATRAVRSGEYNDPLYCNWLELIENFRYTPVDRAALQELIDEVMREPIEVRDRDMQTRQDQHLQALVTCHLYSNYAEAKAYFDRVICEYETTTGIFQTIFYAIGYQTVRRDIYADALNARGLIYWKGLGEPRSDVMAEILFGRALPYSSNALCNLARMYSFIKKEQAVTLFERAISKYNNPAALYHLAELLKGFSHPNEICNYLSRATDLNFAEAMSDLAYEYNSNRFFHPPEEVERDDLALDLLNRSAELGCKNALLQAGRIYLSYEKIVQLVDSSWDLLMTSQALLPATNRVLIAGCQYIVLRLVSIRDLELLERVTAPNTTVDKLLSRNMNERAILAEHLNKLRLIKAFLHGTLATPAQSPLVSSPLVRSFSGAGLFERRVIREILEYADLVPAKKLN